MSDINLDVKGLSILEDISVNNINVDGSFSILNINIFNKEIFYYKHDATETIGENNVIKWNTINFGKAIESNGFKSSRTGLYIFILNLYLATSSSGTLTIGNYINNVYKDIIFSASIINQPDNLISVSIVSQLNSGDTSNFKVQSGTLRYDGTKSSFQGFFVGNS